MGKITKNCAAFIAGLLFSATLLAQDFSFAYMTDVHISVGGQTVEDARKCMADINRQKGLSFAIFAGDITEFGSDEEIRLAKEIFDELTIPYYIVAGNHDAKWSESGCNTFLEVFGYEMFDFEKEGIRFVGCNSGPNMRMAPALVPRETIVWLDSLSTVIDPAQPLIFINHYPMDTSVLNYTQVLDCLKKMNTQLMMCGHWHQDRAMDFEGIPGMIGRSTQKVGKRGPGYNIVTVKGSTITFRERVAEPEITDKPWFTLRMSSGMPAPSNIKYPRQDFSSNGAYPNVKEVWRRADNTDIGAAAVQSGKYVVYANTSGIVYALDAATGKELWKYATGGKIFSTPAVYGKGDAASVIIGSCDKNIYSLDIRSGKVNWKYECGKSVLGSPTIYGGKVYIGASDNTFRALNAKTGKLVWENKEIKGFIEAKPFVDKQQVVIGDWANTLYSFNPANGKLQWSWHKKGSRMLSPAAVWPIKANGNIIFATPERVTYGLDAKTGKQLWRVYGGRESVGLSPDSKNYYVKVMKDSVFMFATSLAPGADKPVKVWGANAEFGYEIAPTPITSVPQGGKENKGFVFIPTDKGNIVALNHADGSIAWKHKVSFALINYIQPLAGNRLLVSTMDGIVTVLEY